MKTLLKKGTRFINQEKKEECLKNWGTLAYNNPRQEIKIQNDAINMNDIFCKRASKPHQ